MTEEIQKEDWEEEGWWLEDASETSVTPDLVGGRFCPVCAEEVIPNSGSQECNYAIVEEFPELVLPTPAMLSKWSKDEWTPKKIMMNELDKVDMVIQQFRVITVYPHLPPESGMPDANCYESGFARMVEEVYGKKGVIILGGNLCKRFTGYELKQVQGLSGVHAVYDIPATFYLPTIRTLYSSGAGEFTLGLKRFVSQLEKPNE